MIKVLIVEDSPMVRELLCHMLSSDPELKVVGTVTNGIEAIEFVKHEKPDVITMDMLMPKMDGIEATRSIMETNPVPIVVVSACWNPKEVEKTFHAIEAGAVAVLEKPRGMDHPDYDNMKKELIQTVKLMSEVRVVRRWPQFRRTDGMEPGQISRDIKLVAIGASTGGPLVLQKILSRLPKDISFPMLIVQHISSGFLQGLIDWLSRTTGFPIHIATHGELPLMGHVYFAPDGFHMEMESDRRIALSKSEPVNGLRPSVSTLFRSVTHSYGKNAIGILLTGMGKDGAKELKLMKEKGAVTIAQDQESSIVHGMPGEAIKLDAAMYVLPPDRIAHALISFGDKKIMEGRCSVL